MIKTNKTVVSLEDWTSYKMKLKVKLKICIQQGK